MKTANIIKEGKIFGIQLFENLQYQETVYCRLKSDIKPYLKKIGYKLQYDFTKLKLGTN
jgi:hypothetical protein